MKISNSLAYLLLISLFISCSEDKLDAKGFTVEPSEESLEGATVDGIEGNALKMETKVSNVLLTGHSQYRLSTKYKVNYAKKNKSFSGDEMTRFIGSNHYYADYMGVGSDEGNNWNYNFMPGIEAVYGYNLLNISI